MIAQPGRPNADQQTDMFVSSVIPTVGQNAESVFRTDSEKSPNHGLSRGGHRLVTRAPSDIYLHPTFIKHGLSQSLMQSCKTNQSWDPSKPELIFITRNNILLKGHEILRSALQNKVGQLLCVEYDYTDDEALLWILAQSRTSQQLNDFQRILLALEFEPSLIERARENQRLGGKLKGSTNLTEDRIIDCRREIATMAYVCEANVGKGQKTRPSPRPRGVSFAARRRGEHSSCLSLARLP